MDTKKEIDSNTTSKNQNTQENNPKFLEQLSTPKIFKRVFSSIRSTGKQTEAPDTAVTLDSESESFINQAAPSGNGFTDTPVSNSDTSDDNTNSSVDGETQHSADPADDNLAATKQKFYANNRYFTISIYAIAVIFIGVIIIKIFMSLDDTIRTLKSIANILMPFFIGALIAFILNPAVKNVNIFYNRICKIKNQKICLALSIASTYILLVGMIILTLLYVVPQIMESLTELINFIPTVSGKIFHLFDNLEEHFPTLDVDIIRKSINDTIPTLLTSLKDFAANLVPALYSMSVSILQWLLNVVIAIIVSIYMLTDKKPLQNSIKAIIYGFVPVKHIRGFIDILKTCNQLFSSFIIGKAIDSLIIGLICFVIMSICQLPYAVLISAIVGVTNMIPYFGPFIGAVPGILIMLLVSPFKALIFAIIILVLQQFDGLILGPKILGDSTGLKPLWIIFAITVGGSLAGVLGMFLGVPVVAVLRYLLNRFLAYRLDKRNLLDTQQHT